MLCLTSRRCSYLVTIHNCRQRGFSLELRRLRRARLSNRELSRARCPHSSGDSQQVGNPTQPNRFSPLFEFFHSCISRIIDSAQISRPHNKPCSFPKQNFLQEGFADLDESGTPLVKYHMLDASRHRQKAGFRRVTWFLLPAFAMAISPGRWPSRITLLRKSRVLDFYWARRGLGIVYDW
ncbi:hypothetical protein V8C40DRAFT_53241 [Trichoderma camerunense]